MTDVVIPLSNGSAWSDNELRFALRSLMRYVADLGRIIVVGHKPAWLNEDAVLHLDVQDRRKSHKDSNMIRKVLAACDHVSGPFVRMSDDQCVLRPVTFGDLPAYGRPMNPATAEPDGKWARKRNRTFVWLRDNGYPTADFDLHCPMLYDPETFRRMAAESPWEPRPGYCINSLYGGFARLTPVSPAGLVARYSEAETASCHKNILKRAHDSRTTFLNYRNASLTRPMRYALSVMFPERSVCETVDHGEQFDPNEWLRAKPSRQREAVVVRGPVDESRMVRRQRSHARLLAMGPEKRRRLRQKARAA